MMAGIFRSGAVAAVAVATAFCAACDEGRRLVPTAPSGTAGAPPEAPSPPPTVVTPRVTLTADSTVVVPGGRLSVSWEAPSSPSPLDWIGFFRAEDPNEAYESGWWSYTGGRPSGTLSLTAPARPGQYEFRYLLDDGYVDVARATVTVR